jgi:hypothetical protein
MRMFPLDKSYTRTPSAEPETKWLASGESAPTLALQLPGPLWSVGEDFGVASHNRNVLSFDPETMC